MNTTAGKGDPYWYEWTVGLVKVVEMLHPESTIQSVSFQVDGFKGWDDVVVKYTNGRRDFIQVKNSRTDANITFGTLVGVDKDGVSLLSSLFDAWKDMKLRPQLDKCIVFTNRAAGEKAGKSDAGVHRPPLLNFFKWLSDAVTNAKSFAEITPEKEWGGAWTEWVTQLKGTDDERLDFLRALQILPNQADLKQLEDGVLTALMAAFQIDRLKALPLLHALDNALRRWSTTEQDVSAEDAFTAMALEAHVDVEHRAPPPPQPFFPSRGKFVVDLENELQATSGPSVIFLSAAPGAGKTSIISEIANRRVSQYFQGIIGLRYFAFRPITPDSPLIPPDADQFVRPDRLWFSLLSQLRMGLQGKLRDYQVPLRNDLLSWTEARAHVLRIAARMGGELGRPFVIVVDGIDHAARAMRVDPAAKQFFSSLPSPDELAGKPIRFLLAGQPAESYSEYPAWLNNTSKVKTLTIGTMVADDILVLLQSKTTPIPPDQHAAVVDVIEEETKGNTLAVVFAVQEAVTCASATELQTRLAERNLGDGLQAYYDAIWRHALTQLNNAPPGTDTALASALCLTPERLTGLLMSSAFSHLNVSAEHWKLLLANLGPLLVAEPDGFRVLHNDVRVYLHGFLSSQSSQAKTTAASWLADHYRKPSSNRWFAHKAVRRLLKDAGREQEWARVFTVEWIFEAAALGIAASDLSDECVEALKQGIVLREWDVMHDLACATETLERWKEHCDYGGAMPSANQVEVVPAFFSTEIFVPPQDRWTKRDLHNLVTDAQSLLKIGEPARATGLITRWLQNLTVIDLCESASGMVVPGGGQNGNELQLNDNGLLESLGNVCRSVGVPVMPGTAVSAIHRQAQKKYEAGWTSASCRMGPFTAPSAFYADRPIRYFNSYEIALPKLVERREWNLVRGLMSEIATCQNKFSHSFQAHAAWWAVRSGACDDHPAWLNILTQRHFGFSNVRKEDFPSALSVSMALAWKDPAAEPGVLAQKVFASLQIEPDRAEEYVHYRPLLRAGATLGRTLSVLQRRGKTHASELLPPHELVQVATALWQYGNHRDAGRLASQLVALTFELNDEHRQALLNAAHPIADKAPMDFRRESLWQLYQRSGEISRLRQWVKAWLDDNGKLWSGDASGRKDVADDLIPLALELGEQELVSKTEDRLRWIQITYRSHEETTLGIPVNWFDELAKLEPTSWRDVGLTLWTVSEACSALGGDDEYSFHLGKALGAAAWASGPADLFQLLTAEYSDCGRETWYYPAANRLIGGFIDHVRRRPQLPVSDKLAGWCLAVGFSRWFHDTDVKTLAELRTALSDSAEDPNERETILDAIASITPGEAQRNPELESANTGSPSKPDVDNTDTWLKRVAAGESVSPEIAARLIGSMQAEQRTTFDADAAALLTAVGTGGAWPWTWGRDDDLFTIARAVSDELLWSLVSAAIKHAGTDSSSWTQGVTRNLQNILLARAAARGAADLRAGLDRILAMHDRWSGGGKGNLSRPSIKIAPAPQVATFQEAALRCLTFVLAARSAEVIQPAIIGIQALITQQPDLITLLLELVEEDIWKQQWILNAAEVWARVHTAELAKAQDILKRWSTTGPLHRRTQAWIVLRILAQTTQTQIPPFPNPPQTQGPGTVNMRSREILATPPTVRGSFQMADTYRSAENAIKRVELALEQDLSEVKDAVSGKLQNETEDEWNQQPWPRRIILSRDIRCSSLQKELILDDAFDQFFSRSPVSSAYECRFAQAYLTSEDPWILRSSPLPDNDVSAWPTEADLGEMGESPDEEDIRRKLLHLATEHGVASTDIVIAARVQVFTLKQDFVFYVWLDQDFERDDPPVTINGRTFAFSFDTWFEPACDNGSFPIAFVSGGYSRLMLSSPAFFPSLLWRTKLEWEPSPEGALIWTSAGTPVARHERIHGQPRSHSTHARQPVLSRWIAKRSAWDQAVEKSGPFHQRDALHVFSSSVEK